MGKAEEGLRVKEGSESFRMEVWVDDRRYAWQERSDRAWMKT